MQKKFFLLGFVAAITMLLGVTAWSSTRSAHADPVNECNKASSSCGDRKADAVIINDSANATLTVNDPVQTIVKTGLGASPTLNTNHSINGSFYTAINTQITGLAATGAVPVGNAIGSGSFNLKLAGSLPCNSTGGQLGAGGIPTGYTIYSAKLNSAADIAALPVAPGSGQTGWADGTAGVDWTKWAADFDDDNQNNIPDYVSGDDTGADSQAQTTEDAPNDPAGLGLPQGVTKEPLFIPYWTADAGLPAPAVRYFGVAPVPGNPVAVDFITFNSWPTAGTSTQYAVILEGSGVGFTLPSNPSTSSIVTCPPFDSTIQLNANDGAGHNVQTITGSGAVSVHMQTAADFDGDGVPNYNDNCDVVFNPTQVDSDSNGIGDACPNSSAGGTGTSDQDGDNTANQNDSCPTTSLPAPAADADPDTDGIGSSCDASPNIPGDGHGYSFPASSTAGSQIGGADPTNASQGYDVHSSITTMAFSIGDAAGSCYSPLPAGQQAGCKSSDATYHKTAPVTWCIMSDHNIQTNPGLNCDAGPNLASKNFTSDSDGDGYSDGCETGRALYIPGTGSDALDASSHPTGGAVPGDCDNDGTPDASDPTPLGTPAALDSDGDGCSDAKEPALTGKPHDPTDPWDFYNVPSPALKLGGLPQASRIDSGIGLGGDVLAVLAYSGDTAGTLNYDQDIDLNGTPDGVQYDRSTNPAHSYLSGPPDGGIGLGSDVLLVLAQSGLSC